MMEEIFAEEKQRYDHYGKTPVEQKEVPYPMDKIVNHKEKTTAKNVIDSGTASTTRNIVNKSLGAQKKLMQLEPF